MFIDGSNDEGRGTPMLPSRFAYHRAGSLEEAFALLDQYGEDAKVLAGGQSLIPMMKLRFANPEHLIDVNHVDGLDGIEERDGTLRIGALVRHNHLAASDVIARYPTIATAAPQIADPLVRNLGTIGGSISHADPAGDLGSVMLALGASVVLNSSGGERVVPMSEFLVDTFTTSIQPNELLTQIQVPGAAPRSGGDYLKLERKVGDWATVGVAVALTLSNGSIGRAGIALTGVGLKNLEATDAEAALAGQAPGTDLFAEAGRLAAGIADPVSDVRGPAEYKKHVVEVYVQRGLARALEHANAG
jgi:carbon-monoxide dehydrogenase medium subunit